MKNLLTFAFIFVTATFTAHATETVNVSTELCGKVEGIQFFTYDYSGNTTNGTPDYQGYLKVSYLPTTVGGKYTHTTETYKIENLAWDKKFKQVVFTGKSGITVCGKHTRLGGTKTNKSCGVKFTSKVVVESTQCPAGGTVMEGTFFVN